MPTVTHFCDEEEWPQNSSQNLHKYPWLCNKQVGFKALAISKSFSSFLISYVRRPTPRTDKGSPSITDIMITGRPTQSDDKGSPDPLGQVS
jgi:hypothetical protein